jgi:hypothetical protein
MSDANTPALDANGTLKDASEIDWVHSPSAEDPPMASKPEKRKRTESMDSSHTEPRREASKHLKKAWSMGRLPWCSNFNGCQNIMRSAQKGSLVEFEGFWLDAVETKDADIRKGFINLELILELGVFGLHALDGDFFARDDTRRC